MSYIRNFTISAIAAISLSACCSKEVISNSVAIVPHPSSVEVYNGSTSIAGATFKCDSKFGEVGQSAVLNFENSLQSSCGLKSGESKSVIAFQKSSSLGEEEYQIVVTPSSIKIKASSDRGVLYAIESMKQLLPISIYNGEEDPASSWSFPLMRISDTPRFRYRGMHLDVSRHFFSVEEVKKYLDVMAIHKLNRFHWHLTDDQGWRVEIKKYPELCLKGAKREQTLVGHLFNSKGYDGTPYGEGMWYSQEEIKEVVEYAKNKGIDVIPEIDLPGHMVAALACYPHLGCTGGPYKVWDRWGVADDVLCIGEPKTIEFIEGVLDEILELFPYEYIHIGGDECPKTRWENCPKCQAKIAELGLKDDDKHSAEHYLQSYITKHVSDYIAPKGRKIIGWDEILEGTLPEGATVMSWRGIEGGIAAAELGHDAIMTAQSYLYFDRYHCEDTKDEPLAIGGVLTVEDLYSREPIPGVLTEQQKKHIIGVQANLWTEYVCSNEHLEYMLLPRLAALSELQWCNPEIKNWERFRRDITHILTIYDTLGYNYAKHILK